MIVTVGRLVPAHPSGLLENALQRVEIELLVLFPYFLYRFATEFVRPSQRLQRVVAVLTIGLSVWTFALPSIPAAGEDRPASFLAYVIVFLVALDAALDRRDGSPVARGPRAAVGRREPHADALVRRGGADRRDHLHRVLDRTRPRSAPCSRS